ncbi:S-layer homology domain-containing protein [Paenibacillus antarcticus]|uniref:SLH domain-containing protein n=1 Tax=Paenibacillus antarcticus TaxID=253703 RepID=A0A168JXR5_9BACL|nr:S-layer homology domain-containing protein [Paenibacillus antarcticus]OAB41244.1 hypothetical protein PBAT_22100 [Paenibacillus antarcticus]
MKKKTFIAVLVTTIALASQFSTWDKPAVANAELSEDMNKGVSTMISSVKLTDITTHWAKGAIDKAVERGFAKGYPDGTFKPNSNVTRAEFIKMTVEALKISVDSTTTGGTWYDAYVNAAKNANLYVESDFNSGNLNSQMTRKEMARLSARAIGEKTTDDTKWMYLATKKGLISGLGAGKLGESDNTTRAQSVTIIDRILTVNAGGSLPVDKYAVASAEVVWHGTNIFTVMPEVFTSNDPTKKDQDAELWKKENMIINSKDGEYSGEIEYVIAIDLADPNDPNLKLVPPISSLKWQNNISSSSLTEGIPVSKWRDSYLIYYKSRVVFSKNSEHYAPISIRNNVPLSISGTDGDVYAYLEGALNKIAPVFKDKPMDQTIFLFPKKGWTQNRPLTIAINTPGYSNTFYKTQQLLTISGPFIKSY